MNKGKKIEKLLDNLLHEFAEIPDTKIEAYRECINKKFTEFKYDEGPKSKLAVTDMFKSYIFQTLGEYQPRLEGTSPLFDINRNHDDRIPSLKKLYPLHNSDALLILSWAGTIKANKLGYITDLNPVLEAELKGNKNRRCKKECFWDIRFENEDDPIDIKVLLSCILGNHSTAHLELRNKFVHRIEGLIENYNRYFKSHKSPINEEDIKVWRKKNEELFEGENVGGYNLVPFLELPVSELKGTEESEISLIIGLKIVSPYGLRCDSESDDDSKFYDPFVVFHFPPDKKEITGVQGVFIPVTLRKNLLQSYSIKNAIAVVMARNMSHNFGSHVLSRLVDPTGVSEEIILSDDNVQYLSSFYQIIFEDGEDEKNRVHYNRLVSYFLSYLKTRQDLLADIVSGVPQVRTSKEFIHEVIAGLDKNRLLLNRISGVQDFKFKFRFEGDINKCADENCVHNKTCGCKDKLVAIHNDIMGQHCLYIIIENIIRNTAKHGGKLPDNVEEHIFNIRLTESSTDSSFYKIIIYDNSKIEGTSYLRLPSKKTLKDKTPPRQEWQPFKYEDYENEIFEVSEENLKFYESRSKKELDYFGTYRKNDEDYHVYSIKNAYKVVIDQNLWVNKNILEPSQSLRHGGLGIIEMKVCAAYLRGIPIEQIESPKFNVPFKNLESENEPQGNNLGRKNLPILRAVNPWKIEYEHKQERNEEAFLNTLGYCFYIPKPTELLIVDDKDELWQELKDSKVNDKESIQRLLKSLKALESNGILLLNTDTEKYQDHVELHEFLFDKEKTYPHQLMLYNKDTTKTDGGFDENSQKLPSLKLSYDTYFTSFMAYYQANQDKYRGQKGIQKYKGGQRIDLVANSKLVLIEAWRAYAHLICDKKRLRLEDSRWRKYIVKTDPDSLDFCHAFDIHGENFSGFDSRFREGSIEIVPSSFNYFYSKLDVGRRSNIFNLTIIKYFDTLLCNVLVIDERIQELCYKNIYQINEDSLSYAQIWDECNVYIPAPFKDNKNRPVAYSNSGLSINFNQKKFDIDFCPRIKKIIEQRFGNHPKNKKVSKGLDYLIIHLGIVEKLMPLMDYDKNRPSEIKSFIEKELICSKTCSDVKVIITSGRGPLAQGLPKDFRFLSYSIISQYLVENRFKFNLTNVLNSSRPKL